MSFHPEDFPSQRNSIVSGTSESQSSQSCPTAAPATNRRRAYSARYSSGNSYDSAIAMPEGAIGSSSSGDAALLDALDRAAAAAAVNDVSGGNMTQRVARHGIPIDVTSSSSGMRPPSSIHRPSMQPAPARTLSRLSSAGDDPTAAFTTDDERRELATISPTELADAETDLRGIVTHFDGMAMGGAEATQQQRLDRLSRAESNSHAVHLPQALLRLDMEIASLLPDFKHAYLTAITRCPPTTTSTASSSSSEGSGWDCYRSAFLEREGYDASVAARKLCKYWKVRQSVFGPEAYCPYYPPNPNTNHRSGDLTLSQCFTPSELEMFLQHNLCHLLERERDGAGRPVLFLDPSRRDLAKFSTDKSMKAIFYLFQLIANDPAVRRRGFVLVVNMRISSKQYDRSSMRTILPFVYDNLPVRCRAIHLINPSAISYYVILPVIKYFLGREMRLRLKVHYGSPSEVARSLEEYRLPSRALPQEVGGSVHIDRHEWMATRLMEEEQLLRQAMQQHRQPQPQLQPQLQLQLQQQQPMVGAFLKSQLPHQQLRPSGGYSTTTFDHTIMMELPGQGGSLSSFFAEMEQLPVKEPPIKRTRSNGSLDVERHTSIPEQSTSYSSISAACIATHAYPAEADSALTTADATLSSAAALYDPILAFSRMRVPQMKGTAKESGKKTKAEKGREPPNKTGTSRGSGRGKRKTTVGRGGKVRKGGRQSDARMSTAIVAKRNNDKLSLRDALEAGGFVFPPKTTGRCAAATVFDSDGVSLAQRKNQLNRRLRALRKKEENEGGEEECSEEEAKDAEPTVPAAAAASGDKDIFLSDLKPAGSSASTKDNKSYDSDGDSFFEVLDELPGIDEIL